MTTPGDWEELLLDIKLCQDCGPGPRAVYRGNPSAKILIVGQAPGREEAKQGKPFVGPAGKVLDQALVSAGLTEEDVLITNPVFFWPRDPDDRRPRAEEVAHGREHLNWILEHVKPKLIIPLGDLATKLFINSPWGMTKLSGQMQEGNIYPIIHPAAILHNPALRPKWEEAWRNLKPTVTRIAEREEPEQPAETPWGPEQPFVHLHNHSEYSKLDGHQTLKEMLEEARRRGFRTIALTDHGTLAGWANFYRKAQAVGIKPILGVEAYLADTRITKEYMHLVLLAETLEGYHNLIRVTSAASAEGTGRTILVWEDLPRLQGCVALTACAGGVVGKPVGKGDFVQAKRNVERLVAALGPNGVFLEVQAHADWKPQADVNKAAIQIARHLELPIMATNDCHYAHTNGWEIQDVMLAVRDNVALDYPDRMRYDVHDLWIKDAAEVRRDLLASGVSAADVAEAMANSVRLAERCKVEAPGAGTSCPSHLYLKGKTPMPSS